MAAPSAPKAKAGAGKASRNRAEQACEAAGREGRGCPKGSAAHQAAARSTYYLTTAISYPNGVPHIGHAYEAIATDALARFQRLDGKDVFFLTGTDEHGLKMVQTAARENLTVQEFAARNAGRFKAMDERLNVSFDRFIRTTEEQHHRSSQVLWNRVQQSGDIYLDRLFGLVLGPRRGLLRRELKPPSARTMSVAARKARRSSGSTSGAISSACPPIRTGC